MVPDLIDFACHLTQHFGVLVFEAQFEGFDAIHSGIMGSNKGEIQALRAKVNSPLLATLPTKMAAFSCNSLLLNWCSASLRWFLRWFLIWA